MKDNIYYYYKRKETFKRDNLLTSQPNGDIKILNNNETFNCNHIIAEVNREVWMKYFDNIDTATEYVMNCLEKHYRIV